MKKIISRNCPFILLILVTFLYSCASPLKRDLLSKSPPRYQGDVTPIEVGIQPMYRPASMKVKLSSVYLVRSSLGGWEEFKKKNRVIKDDMLALGYSHDQADTLIRSLFHDEKLKTEFEETTYEIIFSGVSELVETGDLLSCDTKISRVAIGTVDIALDQPILDVSILMDRYGSIKFFDLALPALAEPEVQTEISGDEYEKILETINYVVTVNKTFPMTSVRTGDVLVRSDPKDLIDILVRKVPESAWLYQTEGNISLEYIVEGWVYLEGKRVILATINYANKLHKPEIDDQVIIEVTGFSLFDSKTFQILHQRQFSSVEFDNDSIGRMVLENLILYEAEVGTQN